VKQAIFYIDDEVGCLKLFQEMYGGKHHVRTAATLGEARRVLAEQPADIVISDQTMPEITGSDFLMEVSKAHPSSYRVLLTGSVGCAQVMPEIGSGIIHFFVPKPWTQQDMLQMLERAAVHFDALKKAC
jgi:DNA-binding NtrC family response regulator